MSAFTAFSAPLLIQYDPEASKALGADHWRVTQAFRYDIGHKGSEQWVTVPAGYLTDGASVPRLFWSMLPPWGSYGQAAVVHDLLCEYLAIVDNGQLKAITRARADEIFNEAMAVLEVADTTRLALTEGVKFYRGVSGVSRPTNTALKRQLEAQWES